MDAIPQLSGSTKVHDLLRQYPFLEEYLSSRYPKFSLLKNPLARATVARMATLHMAAGMAQVSLDQLLRDLADEIQRRTGHRPQVESDPSNQDHPHGARLEALEQIIRDLHAGLPLDEARRRFEQIFRDVDASEIAAMEQELIRKGLSVEEIQRLCDVHVGVFRTALDQHPAPSAPPGHPLHTYLADNRKLTEWANELGKVARQLSADPHDEHAWNSASQILKQLAGVENHYIRKENQLFPALERHGITGPSQVMWGVHNDIRARLRATRTAFDQRDAASFAALATQLARDIVEMVYKEEKILFPMTLEVLSDAEWVEIRRGEDRLGYAIAAPAAPWPPTSNEAPSPPPTTSATDGKWSFETGVLTPTSLSLILRALPCEITYVDENDTVCFYSEGAAHVFPRSPGVIGRKVQNCHPPKSLPIVEEILREFRSGRQTTAEFWIQHHGRFVFIQYVALRDERREYRGCLEIVQDITRLRELQGERRLLQWALEHHSQSSATPSDGSDSSPKAANLET